MYNVAVRLTFCQEGDEAFGKGRRSQGPSTQSRRNMVVIPSRSDSATSVTQMETVGDPLIFAAPFCDPFSSTQVIVVVALVVTLPADRSKQSLHPPPVSAIPGLCSRALSKARCGAWPEPSRPLIHPFCFRDRRGKKRCCLVLSMNGRLLATLLFWWYGELPFSPGVLFVLFLSGQLPRSLAKISAHQLRSSHDKRRR